MKSLWGGRFSEKPNDFFFQFNESFSFDRRLAEVDIIGSKAYARALLKPGIFNADELSQVLDALDELQVELKAKPEILNQALRENFEDVHSFVEFKLIEKVGDLGKKLHTGRSRNDQIATDLRLYLRDELDAILGHIKTLQMALISLAQRYSQAVMPGYTHLQKAQPILFAHYALSFYEMLKRDAARLIDARRRLNIMPLGSGALSGNSMGIDRDALSSDLGFDGPSANSLDAVADRDFALEFMSAASISMVHLSRLAEDLIIYCSDEFRFVRMGDQVSTGSSLMPQKKNPDALELIRGKSGRVIGNQMALLTVLKGLPSCYNKDLQEDKESLFDTVDTFASCLRVMSLVLDTLTIHEDRMALESEKAYMNATDLADYIVSKGLAFREAHHLVGKIVQHALKEQLKLSELSLADYHKFTPLVGSDVYAALEIKAVLGKKSSLGGTCPQRVHDALQKVLLE